MSNLFPRVHNLVVCDAIEETDEEDVVHLLGVRFEIRASQFPHFQPQLWVYVQATGNEGSTTAHVEVVHPDMDDPLSSTVEREVHFLGPLAPITLLWLVDDCVFPAPGVYWVQVFFGQKQLSERMLILTEEALPTDG